MSDLLTDLELGSKNEARQYTNSHLLESPQRRVCMVRLKTVCILVCVNKEHCQLCMLVRKSPTDFLILVCFWIVQKHTCNIVVGLLSDFVSLYDCNSMLGVTCQHLTASMAFARLIALRGHRKFSSHTVALPVMKSRLRSLSSAYETKCEPAEHSMSDTDEATVKE